MGSPTFPVWRAARRSFAPDHPFFSSGNVGRELQAKQVSLNISEEEKAYIGRAEEEESWLINCPIVGCGSKLRGQEQLESHYLMRHTATCSVCAHVFPTKRLLSIHISETHDSFFQAKVARNHPMYECLVEGCSGMFLSDKARNQHLFDKHKFPAAFQFHKKKHPSQKQRQRFRAKQYMEAPTTRSQNERPVENETDVLMSESIESLSGAMSRLTTIDSRVPEAISFGRRRGRAVAGNRPKEVR